MNVHVIATGQTPFGRRSDDLVSLAAEAGRQALEGIGRRPVDLLVVGNMLGGALDGEENLTAAIADRLALERAAGWRVDAASASGAAAFHSAVAAVASGAFHRALVIAAEKMTGVPNDRLSRALARSLSPLERASGATMAGLASLVTQRYLARYPSAASAIDWVTVHARRRAARNPTAQFREAVTVEAVRESRWVAPPLRLLHCSAVSDGAAAVVIERGSGAATVRGTGQALDAWQWTDRADLATFEATREASRRALGMAHGRPRDLGVVELHDAFAPFALIDLEDLGLSAPGGGSEWFSEASLGARGAVVLNPSGGLLGRGHPVGASGLAAIGEIARQLLGEAGPTSVDPRPSLGLAHSIGGLGAHNFVTVLGDGGRR